MSNKINKDDLSWLGKLLRTNSNIKTLGILNNEPRYFTTRLEFCYTVLRYLNEGKFLQVKSIEVEGYMGIINPNMENYKDETNIKMLCLSVYDKDYTKKVDPSDWPLD